MGQDIVDLHFKTQSMKQRLFTSLFFGWVIYSILLAIAFFVSNIIAQHYQFDIRMSTVNLLSNLLQFLLLTLTGFIVYGFLLFILKDYFTQNKSRPVKGVLLYVLATGSFLGTYLMAYHGIKPDVLIDAPLMNAATMLVMSFIPFTAKLIYP